MAINHLHERIYDSCAWIVNYDLQMSVRMMPQTLNLFQIATVYTNMTKDLTSGRYAPSCSPSVDWHTKSHLSDDRGWTFGKCSVRAWLFRKMLLPGKKRGHLSTTRKQSDVVSNGTLRSLSNKRIQKKGNQTWKQCWLFFDAKGITHKGFLTLGQIFNAVY